MKHTITKRHNGKGISYHCIACLRTWSREPDSICPGIAQYAWQQAPEYLQTYTQLRAKHLKPQDRRKPDGCIIVHDEWCWLYDQRQAVPRRTCSDRQRQALELARQHMRTKWACEHCGYEPSSPGELKHYFVQPGLCKDCRDRIQEECRIAEDQQDASRWAQNILARQDWCVLDTETTSLNGYILEIAVVGPDGATLFNSLINPESEVDPGARAVHGITDEELVQAPHLPDVWKDLQTVLAGRLILTYNTEFDEAALARSARRYQLQQLTNKWNCIMEWYAQYCGEWSDYWGHYTWQPLYGGHRALEDAQAAQRCLKLMAETSPGEDGGCSM